MPQNPTIVLHNGVYNRLMADLGDFEAQGDQAGTSDGGDGDGGGSFGGGGSGGLTDAQWLFVTTTYDNGPIIMNYALDHQSGVFREVTDVSGFSLALAYQNNFDTWGQNGVAPSLSAAVLAYDRSPNRKGPGLTLDGRILSIRPDNLDDPSQPGVNGTIVLNQVVIPGQKDEENYFEGIEKFVSPLDKGLTLAESPGLFSKAYRLAAESSTAIGYVGKFTGLTTIITSGSSMISDYRHGDYISGTWNLAKAAGQVVILAGGGEEAELLWNTGTLAVDAIGSLLKK